MQKLFILTYDNIYYMDPGSMCIGSTRERVIEYLRKYPWSNTRQIARAIKAHYRTVYNILASLHVQGKVECKFFIEPFPGCDNGIRVRRWRLIEDED